MTRATSILCPSNRQQGPATNAAIQQQRQYHEVVGDIVCPSQIRGIDYLRDPRLNKVIQQFSRLIRINY